MLLQVQTQESHLIDKLTAYLSDKGPELVLTYGEKIVYSVLTLVIGLYVIKFISNLIGTYSSKLNIDLTVIKFFRNLINLTLKVILVIVVASMLGVQTASFIAILGSAGLALGLALQGSLSNFASGVLILVLKPYKLGDWIKTQDFFGKVMEIKTFTTSLLTLDNKTVIIPNGILSNGIITNFSKEGKIRVDIPVGVSYSSDLQKTREIIIDVLNNNPKVLKEPAASVSVLNLGDSSVDLTVRPWVDPSDYWGVYFESLEQIKQALDKNNIEIPFPQRVIHQAKP